MEQKMKQKMKQKMEEQNKQNKNENQEQQIQALIQRYPALAVIQKDLVRGYELMKDSYAHGGKLLTAGNGGSAADAEHIVGELMKSFKLQRKIDATFAARLADIDHDRGKMLADQLENALTAVSLNGCGALATAYLNDVGSSVFAQQLYGYGEAGDVFLAISTSGNSRNIVDAAVVAKAMGIKVLALTGKGGGKLAALADVLVAVPSEETYMVQELHLPVYHCWCLMLEQFFFGKGKEEQAYENRI